jgi:hypothetical protein
MGVAIADLEERHFKIVSAATVISDRKSKRDIIIIINQAAYMPGTHQFESLLHTDQARNHHLVINNIATCYFDRYGNAGQQSIEVEEISIALRHDGIKYYLKIREPTPQDWETCQVIEFTSPISWSSHSRFRRAKTIVTYNDNTIKEWSKHLGNLNHEATKYSLKATTQLIPSIKAETRLTPHMHLKCRLPSLQPKRLNQGFSTDTFFSEVRSSHGKTCGQVFLSVKSGYTVFIPLKSKAYAYVALSDYIKDVGAPLFLSSDNAKEENLGEWISICRTFGIQKRSSEPYYQHQNKVE